MTSRDRLATSGASLRNLIVADGLSPGTQNPDAPLSELMVASSDAAPLSLRTSAPQADPAAPVEATARLPLPIVLFLVTLFIPWEFWLGTFALSAYRLILLLTTVPCVLMWLTGRAGRFRIADFAFLLFWGWCTISFIAVDGLSASYQSIGILFVETLGPYFLARCYIRDAVTYYGMVRLLSRLVLLLLPFSIFETLTGNDILLNAFSSILRSHPYWTMPPRWGLSRVQSVFEHTILYGVATGSILAMVHTTLGYGERVIWRLTRTVAVGITAFLSLSAGPISAVAVQSIMLLWNAILHNSPQRWKLFGGGIALSYLIVSLISNQTVPEFYITHFSFDAESANFRILIWDFGSASALKHPWFGVSFGEWERPTWMPPSIDMFWLIHAVEHGIPAAILMVVAFVSACATVGFRAGLNQRLTSYRLGYLVTMTSFFIVGWTVDFWNATYVLFLFLVGSGLWLSDPEATSSIGRRKT